MENSNKESKHTESANAISSSLDSRRFPTCTAVFREVSLWWEQGTHQHCSYSLWLGGGRVQSECVWCDCWLNIRPVYRKGRTRNTFIHFSCEHTLAKKLCVEPGVWFFTYASNFKTSGNQTEFPHDFHLFIYRQFMVFTSLNGLFYLFIS